MGDGNKQVITYKNPVPLLEKEYGEQKSEKEDKNALKYWSQIIDIVHPTESEKFKKEIHSLYSSANRTKREVYKLARANKWEWFITFTFDKNKVPDRTDYANLLDKVRKYFNHWKERKCPNMKYLFVPEQHKKIEENGKRAWHFHGLLADAYGLTFIKLTDAEKVQYDIQTNQLYDVFDDRTLSISNEEIFMKYVHIIYIVDSLLDILIENGTIRLHDKYSILSKFEPKPVITTR